MNHIGLYRVSPAYVNYLVPYAPHLFHNRKSTQHNERIYIGIVLQIHDMEYFAPLSSYKDKHRRMSEGLDFIKIRDYAVINLNNMFPIPQNCYQYVDIAQERNPQYRALLLAEYRRIKAMQDRIRKNALQLYRLQVRGDQSALTRRCNDYRLLEELCKEYPYGK